MTASIAVLALVASMLWRGPIARLIYGLIGLALVWHAWG